MATCGGSLCYGSAYGTGPFIILPHFGNSHLANHKSKGCYEGSVSVMVSSWGNGMCVCMVVCQ